jgi:hypothetical protein
MYFLFPVSRAARANKGAHSKREASQTVLISPMLLLKSPIFENEDLYPA